jgi:hypothetical protein
VYGTQYHGAGVVVVVLVLVDVVLDVVVDEVVVELVVVCRQGACAVWHDSVAE